MIEQLDHFRDALWSAMVIKSLRCVANGRKSSRIHQSSMIHPTFSSQIPVRFTTHRVSVLSEYFLRQLSALLLRKRSMQHGIDV